MEKNYHSSWDNILEPNFQSNYFPLIEWFLEAEKWLWKTIYPPEKDIFNAFSLTKYDDLKVVILWQDPYHWAWQAHWLSFSVQKWIKTPPSLRNIYKEIESEFGYQEPNHGDLSSWAEQGVLLLNSILTVEAGNPASHSKIWWEKFTDSVIEQISLQNEWIVFLLWWSFAQAKKALINTEKHVILESSHPSPFSAHRWFLWSQCFQKTNEILERQWKAPINWEIRDNDEQMSFWM